MRIFTCWLALVSCLLLSGCHFHRRPKAQETPAGGQPQADGQQLIVTPEAGLSGRITRANHDLKFVVITFGIGQMPELGRHLVVYRNGLKVGEVRLSGPQQEDNIVADISSGEAAIGDEVRDR